MKKHIILALILGMIATFGYSQGQDVKEGTATHNVQNSGNQSSNSEIGSGKEKIVVFIPNAFTPNGDGINDEFFISHSGNLVSFELTVVDRWGNNVYNSDNPDFKWDGKSSSRMLPQGIYVYVLRASSNTGAEVKRSGTISLVR